MAIYVFGQIKEYVCAKVDYAMTYGQQVLEENFQLSKYVCMEPLEQKELEMYETMGIDRSQK